MIITNIAHTGYIFKRILRKFMSTKFIFLFLLYLFFSPYLAPLDSQKEQRQPPF
jgi:hypothetical protein